MKYKKQKQKQKWELSTEINQMGISVFGIENVSIYSMFGIILQIYRVNKVLGSWLKVREGWY